MGFSYGHVFKNIIPDPRFPAPVDIESRTNKDPKKLFVSKEVKAFFTRHIAHIWGVIDIKQNLNISMP